MDLKRRLLPVGIALALVALLVVSWLPNWDAQQFTRSTKPYVSFDYQWQQQERLRQLVEDIDNRLSVRHEWHKVGPTEAEFLVSIHVSMRQDEGDQPRIQIEATVNNDNTAIDHIIVRGQPAVSNELADRIVKLLTDRIPSK